MFTPSSVSPQLFNKLQKWVNNNPATFTTMQIDLNPIGPRSLFFLASYNIRNYFTQ